MALVKQTSKLCVSALNFVRPASRPNIFFLQKKPSISQFLAERLVKAVNNKIFILERQFDVNVSVPLSHRKLGT